MASSRDAMLRIAALLVVGSGCAVAPVDAPTEGEVSAEVLAANGTSVNGTSVNGISVNGTSVNGTSVNGVSVNGVSVNGVSVNGVSVSGTQLKGIASDGDAVTGSDWIGARLTAQLTNGATLALRIDNTGVLPSPNTDVRTFMISYETSAGWKPLCTSSTNATNEAITLPGTWNLGTVRHQWDANMFSLACRGATFAKCVELGYKGDSLIDTYHAACIRAIRADYCGDGQSHTITGTEINIYDKLGRQLDTQSWALESNWTPDGATCIHKARVLPSLDEGDVPACISDRAQADCPGSGWAGAILIRTEVNK
jgi:hypothetical protein